jgi:AcrR family transcriptional regulator
MATRKYEQRLRAENADLTRQRILTALQEQLQAAPSQPVSLDNIARAARVSRSTIYLVFGSRAGLFDALAERLWAQAGFGQLVEAVQDPDAREHLRRGIRAGVEIFAALRDIGRTLFSMAALDQDAIGGAIGKIEKDRAGGMAHLARRLAEQDILRADVTAEQAADLLWLLTSFDGFDLLYTGRGLTPGQIADTLVTTAERALCR